MKGYTADKNKNEKVKTKIIIRLAKKNCNHNREGK